MPIEVLASPAALPETAEAAALIQAAGADAIHVSANAHNPFANFTDGPLPNTVAAYREHTKTIKRAVTIPVVAVGRMLPEVADAVLARIPGPIVLAPGIVSVRSYDAEQMCLYDLGAVSEGKIKSAATDKADQVRINLILQRYFKASSCICAALLRQIEGGELNAGDVAESNRELYGGHRSRC